MTPEKKEKTKIEISCLEEHDVLSGVLEASFRAWSPSQRPQRKTQEIL
jgi:hypothetical protein